MTDPKAFSEQQDEKYRDKGKERKIVQTQATDLLVKSCQRRINLKHQGYVFFMYGSLL